jgi:hypothetical protein
MKPAFSTVQKVPAKPQIKVAGPIDLDGTEDEAYFWVRVTQGKAEALGTGEMDKKRLTAEVQKVHNAVLAAVEGMHPGGSGPAGAGPEGVTQTIRATTAMWDATIPITSGRFVKTKKVKVQAWALVTTEAPKRMFHVYWEDDAVELT